MNIQLRLEASSDYHAVEAMTREAFWQFWEDDRVICDEHLLVSKLRSAQGFVPELNFVCKADGQLAGHIIYTKSKIVSDDGKDYDTLTFGPLTVLPEFQNKGIGKKLMRHSFAEANRLGHRAVLIFGNSDYYSRVGFRPASEFGITTADGHSFDAFMAYPLYDGALDGIHGRYFIDPVYEQLSQDEALEFDKKFPPKERHAPLPIGLLMNRLKPEAAAAIQGLNLPSLNFIHSKSEREISSLPGIDEQQSKRYVPLHGKMEYAGEKVERSMQNFKNPNYKKVRGSHILEVSCAYCGCFIANYQKVGESNFVKMYNDRIIDGVLDFSLYHGAIFCPKCGERIATRYMTRMDKKEAYRLVPSAFHKKKV